MQSQFSLNHIAGILEGLEETIIYQLCNRAQFKYNETIYQKGKSGFKNNPESLFAIRLRYQEEMDARFGRYQVPEERPFNKDLPAPERDAPPLVSGLALSDINLIDLTPDILSGYQELVKKICLSGDDGHYGSSVEFDVYSLQAISRRVHFGALYVAENKYSSDPETYTKLIREGNTAKINNQLTRKEVEANILRRVADKVEQLQANINHKVRIAVAPEIILNYYKNVIIPLTKKGEIKYLLNRKLTDN
ncbi:MAG TPA: chorismate mutase [Spirochaetota bacterium]|nr:chorismate mutase [Spirochaetota bacterium]